MEQQLVVVNAAELYSEVRKIVQEELLKTKEGEPKDELLSAAEAVKCFNPAISKVTLHRWKKAGLIPEHKIKGRIFYKRSEILAAGTKIIRYQHSKERFTA